MPEPTAVGMAKLAKTILSLRLAPLLEPWQRKRLGIAEAHNHMRLKLAGAQADKFIEDIRTGKKAYDPKSGEIVDLEHVDDANALVIPPAQEPNISDEAKAYLLKVRALRDADDLQKIQNTAAAVEFAASEMDENREASVSPMAVDEDWFSKWRRGAEEVSKVDMQRLWGTLLAKEVRNPGQFHLRTLELMRSISPQDAQLISKAMSFVINRGFVFKDLECLTKHGLVFADLITLEDLGVIGSIEAVGGREYSMPLNETGACAMIFAGKHGFLVIGNSDKKVVKLPALTLTRVGRDFYELGDYADPPMAYIQKVADKIKTDGMRVELGAKVIAPNGNINVVGIKEL